MALIRIKMTDGDELTIDGSDEQTEMIVNWFDRKIEDEVANITDPDLGEVYLARTHVVRVIVDRDN